MKKMISLVLALAMVLSLAVPALAAEPAVTGNQSGEVSGIYNPTISITDVTVAGEGISYDPDSDTYTVTIPAGETSVDVPVVVSGKNLEYASADDTHDVILFSSEYPWYDNMDMFTRNESDGTWIWEITVDSSMLDVDYVVGYRNPGTNMVTHNVKIQQAYSITLNTAENGTVTADKAAAVAGETVELFVEAADGYELETLTVMQGETAVEVAEDHTFVMPAGDVTVTATFKAAEKAYNITISESENGTVVAMVGEQQVTSAHHNDNVTLVVTPDDGYRLKSMTVKDASGDDVTVTDSNTFVMPDSDVTVTAVFEKVYTIEARAAYGNGTVTANMTTAAEGETVTVTFTPDPGYTLFDQDAYDPNNPSDYVELTPGTEANTYTFQMPAFDVQVVGHIVKGGKARNDLYFDNGGNTAWTDVSAYFYTNTGHLIDSVSLTMAESGIYTLPEGAVIPNMAYKVFFYNNADSTGSLDIPTGEANMFTLGTTTDENGQYEGTWSFYTPSQPPVGVTSAEIVWGSLSFTYTDGENGAEGAWSCEDGANKITVTNTGDNAFNAQPLYDAKEGYTEIEGVFYESMEATVNTMYADLYSGDSFTFYLKLKNQPSKALNGETIATVTIRITEGIGE